MVDVKIDPGANDVSCATPKRPYVEEDVERSVFWGDFTQDPVDYRDLLITREDIIHRVIRKALSIWCVSSVDYWIDRDTLNVSVRLGGDLLLLLLFLNPFLFLAIPHAIRRRMSRCDLMSTVTGLYDVRVHFLWFERLPDFRSSRWLFDLNTLESDEDLVLLYLETEIKSQDEYWDTTVPLITSEVPRDEQVVEDLGGEFD